MKSIEEISASYNQQQTAIHLVCPPVSKTESRFTAMPKLSENDRSRLLGMLDAGLSLNETVRRMGVQKKTVKMWRDRFRQTGSVKDLPRSGRPRVTSANQDASIINKAESNRRLTGKKDHFDTHFIIKYTCRPSF